MGYKLWNMGKDKNRNMVGIIISNSLKKYVVDVR